MLLTIDSKELVVTTDDVDVRRLERLGNHFRLSFGNFLLRLDRAELDLLFLVQFELELFVLAPNPVKELHRFGFLGDPLGVS